MTAAQPTAALALSKHDRWLLAGDSGPAAALAMSILVRMAEVQRAERMLDIEAAHLDSTLYMGEATLAFAERLAEMKAQVVVPTTLNVSGVDAAGWHDWAVPPQWAERAQRQMHAYQQMGAEPTWTCAPYQTSFKPSFGQQIAWGESNAIVFANAVIGARTERYPDLLDVCAAITGRVPAVGLHLAPNRLGQVLVQLNGVPVELQAHDAFWPVFGHWLGRTVGDRIAVIDGIEVTPEEDQLKAFGAAAASSGSVALFHMVGITPEARTLVEAFGGRDPQATLQAGMGELRAARAELTSHDGQSVDMVVLGSPHFSLHEFGQLAPLLSGRQRAADTELLVTSSRAMAALAQKSGLLEPLRQFGGKVTLDTCILTTPMLPESVRTLMTNSAKYAYYAPGLLNTQVVFGSLEDCIRSAEAGHVIRDESLWQRA